MKKTKNILCRVTAIALVAVMCLAVFTSCGKKPSEVDVLKTEHFSVTAGMLAYAAYDSYYEYLNYYGEALFSSYFGIDTSVSLNEQYYNKEKGTTWYDVFVEDAISGTFMSALPLCEAAMAEGMELNEVDNKYIDNSIADLEALAKKQNMTLADYIESLYGKGVTENDIRKTYEMFRLANKKLMKDYDLAEVTEEEFNTYVAKDPDSYLCRDVISFKLTLSNDADKNDKIKEYATKIAATTNKDAFTTAVKEFIDSEYCVDDITDIDKAIVSTYYQNNKEDSKKTELDKWMFKTETAIGSTYTNESSTDYTVYMAVSESAKDMSETRNMKHILFDADIYNSLDNATKLAYTAFEEWTNSGKTEEKFKELAMKYTTDYASAYSGGYYANVAKGDLVKELDEWLFDDSRKYGDSTVITSEYGIHIIVYCGEGEPFWKVSVIESIKDEKASELLEDYTELYTVEKLQNNFKYIPSV